MCQGLGPRKHDEISEIDRKSGLPSSLFPRSIGSTIMFVIISVVIIVMTVSSSSSSSSSSSTHAPMLGPARWNPDRVAKRPGSFAEELIKIQQEEQQGALRLSR